METIKGIEFHRVSNDVNGNPRYVTHFLSLMPDNKTSKDFGGISEAYKTLCKAANTIGGRKYHTKSFGGGIVFQSYNLPTLAENINELKNSL